MKPIESRKHHFVPQLILRNFAPNGKSLFAFDKWESKSFPLSVKDAAAEKGFYSFVGGEGAECLEDYFQEIENLAAPLISVIVEQRKLPTFSHSQRIELCRFAVAQLMRSRNQLALWFQTGDLLRTLASQGTDEFKAWVGEHDLEVERAHLLSGMRKHIEHFVPYFTDKDIMLFITTENSRILIIGDSPLVRTNTLKSTEQDGNLGLARTGIEIYLPLSPNVLLGFLCRSINLNLRAAIAQFGRRATEAAFDYVLSVEMNRPLSLEDTNAEFYNSLQIAAAERHVYSFNDDFSLVQKMLGDNSMFRAGKRMVSNLDEIIERGKVDIHES